MVPDEWDLSDMKALITADRRGWTPILASALAEAGADVAVAGWDSEHVAQAARAVKEWGRNSQEIVADLTQGVEASGTVRQVVETWGRLDILVNNAQAQFGQPFTDITEEQWDRLMGYNVRTPFLLCQASGRQMLRQGGGRIINIISGLAERGLCNSAAYAASQGAVLQLTRSLALEWAQDSIRVNAIATGWLSLEEAHEEQSQESQLSRFIPLRRLGHPKEIAPLLIYLASNACDFVTGQAIFVDGGAIAHG